MIGVSAAVGVLIAGVSPGLPIPAAAFGQNVAGISSGASADVELRSLRLWDTGTRWDQIETAPDQYTWDTLGAAVDNARTGGATDVLYVLGSTPQWAARDPQIPGLYGPGTTSLPKDTEDYVDFVREVANRYKGRITAYQIWNEANTRSFYEGDWTALAKLTRRAHDAIKLIDPSAQVVGASSTVIPGKLFQTESFFVRYARAIHDVGDPVDAMAVHLYPVDTSKGPEARVGSIRAAQRVMNRVGIDRPLWDTEVNYGDRRDPARQVVPKPKKAATYVSRTYLDSARYNVERTFWYGWDIDTLGISLSNPDGSPTRAGRAYLNTRDWMLAGSWKGCKTKGKVTTCKVGKTKILYASKKKTVKRPSGVTQVCKLTGKCSAAGSKIKVGSAPIRLS